jgi:adenosylmethionine-8-amino-7-oxononanoate aminotransferase
MSIQFWSNRGERRLGVLALENAYHGDTFGAMSVGHRGIFSAPFNDLLFDVTHLPTAASPEGLELCRRLCAKGDVAAFIFEPSVQGAAGMQMYDGKVLESYIEVCKSFGVLCIADEVMTGFGRTGPLFASSALPLPPDMVCLSKGLTGGTLPLAVTSCTEAIYSAFVSTDRSKTLFHGHTFTANPIACAAARASLKLTCSVECDAARARIERSHRTFGELLARRSDVRNVRIAGTILAFDLAALKTVDSKTGTHSVKNALVAAFVKAGVLLRPLGEVIYFMPPYCISEEELTLSYRAILASLDGLDGLEKSNRY